METKVGFSCCIESGCKRAQSDNLISSYSKILSTENIIAEDGVVPVKAPAPAFSEPMDIMTALLLVLKKPLAHGALIYGLHEAIKVIEKHAALLCVLAEDCNQLDYQKLVKALCAGHNVRLVTVPRAKTLGEWDGIDSEGKLRKVVGCSCLAVKDYGEESEGLHIVQELVEAERYTRMWILMWFGENG